MPDHETDSNAAEQGHGRGSGAVVVAGILGAAVGAAAAMLLSPWRGPEARERLKERAKDVGSRVGAKAKDVGTQVGAKAKDVGTQIGTKAKEMAAKAREACPCRAGEEDEDD